MTTPDDLESVAIEVATAAAALVRDVVGQAAVLRTKSSETDVVTATDLRSEQLIRGEIERRFPGSSFIGEEYPEHHGDGDLVWVIDPIDGTVNFLYDLPVIAISIAARRRGTTVAGAVADVLRGEVFSAADQAGARRDGATIEASDVDELAAALIATGYSYDRAARARQAHTVSRVLPLARDVRSMGSAALQLCWVACGRLDGYYETGLSPWDYEAGALIAREAGALVRYPSPANEHTTVAAASRIDAALRAVVEPSADAHVSIS